MTKDQIDALELWIISIIVDRASDYVEDAVHRTEMRKGFEESLRVSVDD